MVGSLYQPPPPSLPVAATAATLLLAVAAALAVATAAATEKSIDALRQSDRAVLRGLPICLEEAHSHSGSHHSGSRHSDPSSQEQPSGKSFEGCGGKFIPTPTTLSRRGRTVRPPICLEEAHSEEWPSCSIMSPAVRPSSHQISRVSKSKNSTRKEVTAALKGAILRQEAEKRSAATELARKKEKKRSPRSQQKKTKKRRSPRSQQKKRKENARQGRSKKTEEGTLAKVAAKRKQSRTGARRLWPARLLWPSWLLWPSTVRRAWEDRQGCCWREDHTEGPLMLGLQWCGRLRGQISWWPFERRRHKRRPTRYCTRPRQTPRMESSLAGSSLRMGRAERRRVMK
jgi:hypothetical protein